MPRTVDLCTCPGRRRHLPTRNWKHPGLRPPSLKFWLCTKSCRWLLIWLLQPRCDTTRVLLFDSSKLGAGGLGLHTRLHTTIKTHTAARWRHTDRMFACVVLRHQTCSNLVQSPSAVCNTIGCLLVQPPNRAVCLACAIRAA